ncbi:MAG: general secretion pathway protein GspB [Burkholderiaceae bacterium]|nr:general secretion pathway protein GspB [Burkholderiaceae bacterium]
MSYILDALRKADAERGATATAALGTPGAADTPDAQADAAPSIPFTLEKRFLAWGVVLSVLIAAIVAVRFMDNGPAQSAQADAVAWPAAPSASASVASSAPAPATAPMLVPAPAPVSTAPKSTPATAPAPRSATSKAKTEGVSAGSAVHAGPASLATAPATIPSATPTTPAASAPQRIFSREELPADIRATLPALAVSGATYSANPAHRMLIVNGQVYQEGAQVAPQVVLEQIGPSSAVLRHRDYRLRIGY